MSPRRISLARVFSIFGLLLFGGVCFSQVNQVVKFAEGDYRLQLYLPEADLSSLAMELQPKKKSRYVSENNAVMDFDFVVYHRTSHGHRPFGKIRYSLKVKSQGDLLHCQFYNFRYSEYRRSARYGRMMEVRTKPKTMESARTELNEVQWGTLQWRLEKAIGHKVKSLLSLDQSRPSDTLSSR